MVGRQLGTPPLPPVSLSHTYVHKLMWCENILDDEIYSTVLVVVSRQRVGDGIRKFRIEKRTNMEAASHPNRYR